MTSTRGGGGGTPIRSVTLPDRDGSGNGENGTTRSLARARAMCTSYNEIPGLKTQGMGRRITPIRVPATHSGRLAAVSLAPGT